MTRIFGILNITPDSFSDGGKYSSADAAISQFQKLVEQGAYAIDIGGQSTRPGAIKLSHEEEWNRIEPVLREIKKINKDTQISIDSFYPETIKKALNYRINIINDVIGFESDEMKKLAASSGKKIVFMHNLGIPVDKNKTLSENSDVVKTLLIWAKQKIKELEKAGIKKADMIFDPGLGFGKTRDQNFEIIRNIEKFKKLDVEILTGHSEKSFLNKFTDKPAGERNVETQIITYELAKKKIDYVRVHDVAANLRAINLADKF